MSFLDLQPLITPLVFPNVCCHFLIFVLPKMMKLTNLPVLDTTKSFVLFVCILQQVGGFPPGLRCPPPRKPPTTELLLKVALNIVTLTTYKQQYIVWSAKCPWNFVLKLYNYSGWQTFNSTLSLTTVYPRSSVNQVKTLKNCKDILE